MIFRGKRAEIKMATRFVCAGCGAPAAWKRTTHMLFEGIDWRCPQCGSLAYYEAEYGREIYYAEAKDCGANAGGADDARCVSGQP